MKLVFTADLHIGSAFRGENAALRNAELIKSFEGILRYAAEIGAGAVLIGGDLFDTPFPPPEIAAAVRNIIASSKLCVALVCGNHDPLSECAFYRDPPQNMFVFPACPTSLDLSGVTVVGASVNRSTDRADLFEGYRRDGDFLVLAHGELNGTDEIPLGARTLADTGAKLSLLGHIHKSGVAVLQNGRHALYCGTPAGRGFDECGEKGFFVIDTDSFSYTYVKNNCKIYREYNIDVNGAGSLEEILGKLSDLKIGENEIARAVLTGRISPALDIDVRGILPYFPTLCEIIDKTEPDIDIDVLLRENSPEGEFVRVLMSDSECDPKLVKDALKEGIAALRAKK